MIACAELVVAWSPLCHEPARFLDQYDLPADVDPLCDWLFNQASPELVLGAAPVLPVGADLFAIDDAGKWSVIQPVAPEGDAILDLVAWHPCAPERWRLMTGQGEALGQREIELQQEVDGPLRVFATPLSWHRAGGRGVCLLRPQWHVAQRLFLFERELIVDCLELGEELDAMLRFRPAPAILIGQEP
jgi:hypothetical protein